MSFTAVYDTSARLTADWIDEMRKARGSLPDWAGIPVSIKDMFGPGQFHLHGRIGGGGGTPSHRRVHSRRGQGG
jgi:hypothetical protein